MSLLVDVLCGCCWTQCVWCLIYHPSAMVCWCADAFNELIENLQHGIGPRLIVSVQCQWHSLWKRIVMEFAKIDIWDRKRLIKYSLYSLSIYYLKIPPLYFFIDKLTPSLFIIKVWHDVQVAPIDIIKRSFLWRVQVQQFGRRENFIHVSIDTGVRLGSFWSIAVKTAAWSERSARVYFMAACPTCRV